MGNWWRGNVTGRQTGRQTGRIQTTHILNTKSNQTDRLIKERERRNPWGSKRCNRNLSLSYRLSQTFEVIEMGILLGPGTPPTCSLDSGLAGSVPTDWVLGSYEMVISELIWYLRGWPLVAGSVSVSGGITMCWGIEIPPAGVNVWEAKGGGINSLESTWMTALNIGFNYLSLFRPYLRVDFGFGRSNVKSNAGCSSYDVWFRFLDLFGSECLCRWSWWERCLLLPPCGFVLTVSSVVRSVEHVEEQLSIFRLLECLLLCLWWECECLWWCRWSHLEQRLCREDERWCCLGTSRKSSNKVGIDWAGWMWWVILYRLDIKSTWSLSWFGSNSSTNAESSAGRLSNLSGGIFPPPPLSYGGL